MLKQLSKKAGFVAAIAGAAVVGGATTAFVTAAIPSSTDGKIHGCYRNAASLTDTKGALRVVDSDANEACSNQETALNWPAMNSAGPKVAYFAITSQGTLDTSFSSGVQDMKLVALPLGEFPQSQEYNVCLKLAFTPKVGLDRLDGSRAAGYAPDAANINTDCGDGYNAELSARRQLANNQFYAYKYAFFN